jgi:hypothetical protein
VTGDVVPLGLGAPLADPVSVWPATAVIELVPEVAALLGDQPGERVRAAIAAQAGVAPEQVEAVVVSVTAAGSALVRLGCDSMAARALSVAARRRASSPAEALHAAVLALG